MVQSYDHLLGLFVFLGRTLIQSDPLFLARHLVQYAMNIRQTFVADYTIKP